MDVVLGHIFVFILIPVNPYITAIRFMSLVGHPFCHILSNWWPWLCKRVCKFCHMHFVVLRNLVILHLELHFSIFNR